MKIPEILPVISIKRARQRYGEAYKNFKPLLTFVDREFIFYIFDNLVVYNFCEDYDYAKFNTPMDYDPFYGVDVKFRFKFDDTVYRYYINDVVSYEVGGDLYEI
ncbi:hypothetical protein [Microvirus mar30]|uniref:Uncharacterized protein n=1 Tax=Microvirus mar30 TaxID=2851164 RepID=A0A8F5MK86_9VIRU|nr:hypothetical protein [Microvirus mar30]